MEETIRILVVDDEPDIRRICRILLENSGYTVLEAATGLEAVETIRRCPEIDLILMDIMMPDLDGYDACSRLRACSTAPVLFLTAKTQENDKRRAYDAGGDDYLAKPFSHAELMMKVESLLRRYRVYKNKSSGRMLRPGIVLDEENRRVLLDGAAEQNTDTQFFQNRTLFSAAAAKTHAAALLSYAKLPQNTSIFFLNTVILTVENAKQCVYNV